MFLGNERSSTVTIFDISAFPDSDPVMIDQVVMANPTNDVTSTWGELYENQAVGAIDPESMKWVPSSHYEGYLFVAGSVSGTLLALKVKRPLSENMDAPMDSVRICRWSASRA